MKLSSSTIEILKNFATINQGILFKPGQKISTMSITKTGFAEVTVTETFPQRFAIYSLPEFLGILGMFSEQPEITLDTNHMVISSGKNKVKYFYSSENMIVTPPDGKEPVLPTEDVDLVLTADALTQINKAAAIMKLDMIGISKDGVRAYLSKTKDSTSNVYSLEVDVTTTETKEFNLKIENLKMIPGSYNVTISAKGLARFINQEDTSLIYHIPLEKK